MDTTTSTALANHDKVNDFRLKYRLKCSLQVSLSLSSLTFLSLPLLSLILSHCL